MDYGQPVNTPSEAGFFTAGVGDAPENFNPDLENSLNTENGLNAGIYSPDRDLGNIGNTAITSSETPAESPLDQPEATKTPEDPNQLGQVVNLEMPPALEPEPLEQTPKTPPEHLADMSQITRENDRISLKTIKAVEKATADFNRGAISPADLDNFVADATETYMKTFGGYAKWKGGE